MAWCGWSGVQRRCRLSRCIASSPNQLAYRYKGRTRHSCQSLSSAGLKIEGGNPLSLFFYLKQIIICWTEKDNSRPPQYTSYSCLMHPNMECHSQSQNSRATFDSWSYKKKELSSLAAACLRLLSPTSKPFHCHFFFPTTCA